MDRVVVVGGVSGDAIKMAPVLRALDERGIPYTYVHTSQHRDASLEIAKIFDTRGPDVFLSEQLAPINTVTDMRRWSVATLRQGLRSSEVWRRPGGWTLVHGDTESTVIGAIVARRFRHRVIHVEAGLRSLSLRDPFPEEANRIFVDKLSDVLMTPDSVSSSYVRRSNTRKLVVDTGGNTVFDALKIVTANGRKAAHPFGAPGTYALATVHRKETLYSPKRLRFAVNTIRWAAKVMKINLLLHSPTRHALERQRLMHRLTGEPNIVLHEFLLPYDEFISALGDAAFLITDGGGLQEETWWLDTPCLLLRRRTERTIGLGETAVIGHFSRANVHHFIDHFPELHRRGSYDLSHSPTKVIVDQLERMLD